MHCEDTAHFPEDCRGLRASATSAAGTRASFSSRCSTAAGSALTACSTCSLRAVSSLITAMKLLTKDTLRELPCLSEAGKPGRKTRLPYLLHAADICPAITRGSVRYRSLPCCLLGTAGERYKDKHHREPYMPAHSRRDSRVVIPRASGLAQAGEICGFEQGTDLRHSPIAGCL